MARIVTRTYDELLVTDEVAKQVSEDKIKPDDLNLPYTIQHDEGLWVGALKDIATVFLEDKKLPTFLLKDDEVVVFHNKHGYGRYQARYEPGYGYLDVPSQYQIGAGVAKLREDSLGRKHFITVKTENFTKYEEYWRDYLTKLDEFNELKEPWKNHTLSNQQ